ncbi:hypothetical protein OIE13_06040 [Streptosporangium sp. NBC_01810]|uniref:hypothetical protein n=1 Tax=Streptosporangium sp. NBC_01810 TaxID=2975951 RepID=UPI002DD84C7C|nr:hypothetical protein [Streptosporangium sp. NBC_01810]WSA27434.1 hypothetical protein OIE13_06040 [Streptosporangium sp. NBC_01810]
MDAATVLPHVIKFVGVAISIVGILVTAPDGTRRVVGEVRVWLGQRRNQLQAALALIFPGARRVTTIQLGMAEEVSAVSKLTVIKSGGYKWDPSTPIDERFQLLRSYIESVEERHNQLASQVSKEASQREEDLAALERKLTAAITELRRLFDEKDQQAARIDGKGLPILGIGTVLSNYSTEGGELLPWYVVLLILAASLTITIGVGWSSWRQHRKPRLPKPTSQV